MSEKTIVKDLKEKNIGRLYYIYGNEEYLKRYYYDEIIKNAVSALPEFNSIEFTGKSFDMTDFCNSINGYPVMSDKKTVSVIDFDSSLLKKSFAAELADVLKQIPDFCTVVFYDSQIKSGVSNAALLKVIEACKGTAAKVDHPTAVRLAAWSLRHFKNEGKKISDEDIRYLLEISDTDMLSLKNEISKLCSGVKGDTVTRHDIDTIVTKSIEANRFEIIDAFCGENYDKVYSVIDRLYRQNTDDIVIASVFYRAFLDLWHARAALDTGKTQQDLAKDFGMKPYAALKAVKNLKGMSADFLRSAVLLSLKLDRELKSTPYDKRGLITVYTADLINRRKNG